MLKAIRIFLAVVAILAVTLLFVDVSGYAAAHWGWLAKVQFMPALLAANLSVLAALVALTLLFGRVYCSVICPLGVFQDVVIWLRGHIGPRRKRHNRFRYSDAHPAWRIGILGVFACLVIAGALSVTATAVAGLIEPYSAYGRIASQLLGPVYRAGNDLLADWAAANDSYMFSHSAVRPILWGLFGVSAATAVTVIAFAWTSGRNYCNIVCPVGTILGYLSRYQFLAPVIDTDRCNGCGKCARNCKSQCIDPKEHAIDYSRCVVCMDCLEECSTHAISYTRRSHAAGRRPGPAPARHSAKSSVKTNPDTRRRAFLIGGAIAAGAVAARAFEKTTDGGLKPLKNKQRHPGAVDAVPAGARSLHHFQAHCTACQLCVNVCPEGILQPAMDSVTHLMQPRLVFTGGFCRPECNRCSEACPVGAITPVTLEEKTSIKIGTAVVDYSACIGALGQHCGSCSRHCPAGAITMVPVKETPDSPKQPVVDSEACIGCGSCEYHCPVATVRSSRRDCAAIHVDGIEIHRSV